VTDATARWFFDISIGATTAVRPAYSDARKRFAGQAGRVLANTLRRPNRQCGNVAFWYLADLTTVFADVRFRG
jgi:hypothetical protein